MWGKHLSENTKKKLSEASKGEKNHFYGKKHTDEAKKKISEANKGPNYKLRGIVRSEETRKKLSEIAKKRTGDKNHMYGKHLSEEARKILSENHKGRHYYNNGVINIMTYECPEGFVPGRLKTWTDNKK